jgi:hypothetical protein
MWNGSALEALTVANWGNYDIALAETPASSYFYVGDWPAALTTKGWYIVDIYVRAGGSPAIGDTLSISQTGYWDGTSFLKWASDAEQIAGTNQTPGDLYAAIGNIATTGAPAYEAASSFTKTTGGTEVGTFSNADTSNSVYHQIPDSGGTLDVYYEYTLRPDEVATGVLFKGRMTGSGDNAAVQAYNWSGSAWVTLFSLSGVNTTTDTTQSPALVSKYTGTGVNVGKVRIRIYGTGLTSANLYVDQCIIAKASTSRTVGYSDGAVWINTLSSNTNTVNYVDGVADNPVSTYAAAKTIAASLGLKRFRIANGSVITLTSTAAAYSHAGSNWTLALGGQAIDGAYFEGAEVSGVGTNITQATFVDCHLNAGTTIGPSRFLRCGFAGTSGSKVTAGSAGEFLIVDCYSEVAGSGTPYFSFPGVCGVNFRRWSGGSNIALDNASATITMEVLTGGGQTIATAGASIELRGICRAVTFNGIASGATCQIDAVTGPITLAGADGTVNVYGICSAVTDNRTGSPTLNVYADIHADAATILADTNELQTDWVNGGRLDLLLDASVASGAGTGARTVTITVNDGSTALESARVRLTKGAEAYLQTTNVNGQCTFNVDDGTWTVAITLAGYSYAGSSLVVNGDETATYSMTAYAISAPAAPTLTTGYALCLGIDGLPEAGVIITAQMTAGPGDAGYALDNGMIEFTSDANGLAQYTGFVRGASYRFRRGKRAFVNDAALAPETASWSLTEILGNP